MLGIILELHHTIELVIPSIRAAHQVRLSATPHSTEFAPWPQAFRLVILTMLIVHGKDRSAAVLCTSRLRTRLSPMGTWRKIAWLPVRAASIPERKKAPGVPRGLRLRLLHHSRPLAKPRRVK
jgi:hypothetical protein